MHNHFLNNQNGSGEQRIVTELIRFNCVYFFLFPPHPQPQFPRAFRFTMFRTITKISADSITATIPFAMVLPEEKREMIHNSRQYKRCGDIVQRDS